MGAGSPYWIPHMTQIRMCKSIGCCNPIEPLSNQDFCTACLNESTGSQELSARYPHHYRTVGDVTELDVFAINQMFGLQDPSGCLQHAVSRLLLASTHPTRTTYADIREARDTLTRWLQLNLSMNQGTP